MKWEDLSSNALRSTNHFLPCGMSNPKNTVTVRKIRRRRSIRNFPWEVPIPRSRQDVITKCKSLRTSFRKETKTLDNSQKSGAASESFFFFFLFVFAQKANAMATPAASVSLITSGLQLISAQLGWLIYWTVRGRVQFHCTVMLHDNVDLLGTVYDDVTMDACTVEGQTNHENVFHNLGMGGWGWIRARSFFLNSCLELFVMQSSRECRVNETYTRHIFTKMRVASNCYLSATYSSACPT